MKSNKIGKLERTLRLKTQKEKDIFEITKLQINILNEVNRVLEENGWNKSILAKKLGCSKSYISRIFSVDKLMNLELLSKLERVFGFKWKFEAIDYKLESALSPRVYDVNESSRIYMIEGFRIDESTHWNVENNEIKHLVKKESKIIYPTSYKLYKPYKPINITGRETINKTNGNKRSKN